MTIAKENEDGSAIVELPKDDEPEVEVIEEGSVKNQLPDSGHEEDDESEEDSESENISLSPAQRAEHNRTRAEERIKRKEKRDAAKRKDKALIASLQANNAALATRLAKVESAQQGLHISKVESAIDEQERLINQIKHHMISVEDRASYVELADRLADEKIKLNELKSQKENVVKAANAPKSPVGNPRKAEEDRYTRQWMARNSWFDINGKGGDSKIAIAVSDTLTEEGLDSSLPEYWEELDYRLREQLPHRYEKSRRAAPPVGGSRNDTVVSSAKTNKEFHISAARKQALIEAGVWDDPVLRLRHVKRYQLWDRENKVD